jgi:hypothetical protein
MKEVCSPNSNRQEPKPQPLPQSSTSRGVKPTAVYGDENPPFMKT